MRTDDMGAEASVWRAKGTSETGEGVEEGSGAWGCSKYIVYMHADCPM